MSDAYDFIHNLAVSLYYGLDSVQFPVLGVSIFTVLLAVLVLNLVFWVLSKFTGGSQDKEERARLDNNNHYIYKR